MTKSSLVVCEYNRIDVGYIIKLMDNQRQRIVLLAGVTINGACIQTKGTIQEIKLHSKRIRQEIKLHSKRIRHDCIITQNIDIYLGKTKRACTMYIYL